MAVFPSTEDVSGPFVQHQILQLLVGAGFQFERLRFGDFWLFYGDSKLIIPRSKKRTFRMLKKGLPRLVAIRKKDRAMKNSDSKEVKGLRDSHTRVIAS